MNTLSRDACIQALRGRMLELTDEDHCICEVAARQGLLCHGFAQWSFDELKRRYWWLADRRPDITRPELERLANIWQVARQKVFGTETACDTQALEHDTCGGFEDWTNADLAHYHRELLGEHVRVADDAED